MLAYDIENRVVLELDNLDMTGIDPELGDLRKMIVRKAQHMFGRARKDQTLLKAPLLFQQRQVEWSR